jgi:hypothetical protein
MGSGMGSDAFGNHMKVLHLSRYAQAHRGYRRIFNDLAFSYDQTHAAYAQAHGCQIWVSSLTHSSQKTYVICDFYGERVYGNGFMVLMVMVLKP